MAKELTTEHLAAIINKAKSVAESKISENEDSKIIKTQEELDSITEGVYILGYTLSNDICNKVHSGISYYSQQYPFGLILVAYNFTGMPVQLIYSHYGVCIGRMKSGNSFSNWVVMRPKYYENDSIDGSAIKAKAITGDKLVNNLITQEKLATILYDELSNDFKLFEFDISSLDLEGLVNDLILNQTEFNRLNNYISENGHESVLVKFKLSHFDIIYNKVLTIDRINGNYIEFSPFFGGDGGVDNRIIKIMVNKNTRKVFSDHCWINGINITANSITENQLSFNPYIRSNNPITTVTSLSSFTNRYGTYLYNITANITLSITDNATFNEAYIIIHNTSTATRQIAIPTTDNYVSLSGDMLQIAAGGYAELSIIRDTTNNINYIRFA